MSTTIGTVTAKLTTDNTQYDAAMKTSGEVTTATSRAAAAEQKKAAEAIAFAQKFSGDAVSENAKKYVAALEVQKTANADLRKSLALSKTEFMGNAEATNLAAAALQRKTAADLAAAAAANTLAGANDHVAVSQRMAASAAVRGLESGNVGIRAVENFITTIPGVGAALQTIFPLIGAAAFAGMLVKMGVDLYDLEQKGKHAGQEINTAFGEMNQKLEASNDEIELANSKLQDQIDKLSGHPNNGAATALNEARVAADKLQESLSGDVKALGELLKQHDVSFFEGALSGVASTGGSSKEIDDFAKTVEKQGAVAHRAYHDAMVAAGADQAMQEAATKAYYGRMDQIAGDAARKMRQRATDIAAEQKRGDAMADEAAAGGVIFSSKDMTPVRASFEDAAETFDKVQGRAQDAGMNVQLNKQKGSLDGQKDAGEARRKADEEARKAAAARLKSMEADLAAQNLMQSSTVKSEYDFWADRIDTFKKGSDQYNSILEKEAELAKQGAEQVSAVIKRLKAEMKQDARDAAKALVDANRVMPEWTMYTHRDSAKSDSDARTLGAKGTEGDAAAQIQELQRQAGRVITQAQAAVAIAQQHQRAFDAEMAALQANAADQRQYEGLTAAQKTALQNKYATDMQSAQTKFTEQSAQDRFAINPPDSSGLVGAKDALADFAAQARDSAAIMKNLVSGTLNRVNDTIIAQITGRGQRGQWTKTGQDVFAGIAGAGIKKAEGGVLDALGLGSKDGSSEAKALFVRMASGGVASAVGGGGKSGLGGFLSAIGIPGFAEGGSPSSGWAMVGEKGPELVNFGSSATVIPNHQLQSTFGGGGGFSPTVHVDARGAMDEAAVEAAGHRGAMRAMQTVAPHIMAGSIQAGQDRQQRRPSTAR